MNGTSGQPFVLVPGACLGGWCWRTVAQLLREAGHEAYPVTLTGLGERAHLARPDVDLDTHVADVCGVLEYEDLHDVVLVGHSYAGPVITGVADRAAERIGTLVYLDTSPLPANTAIADVQPPELRERQRRDADEGGDGWLWPLPGRATLASGIFGSAAGLGDADFQLLEQRGTPQPFATFTTPLRLTANLPASFARHVIFCSDGGIDVATVRALLADGDPRAQPFADPDWQLHELATGHWSMFSQPHELAETLLQIAGSASKRTTSAPTS